ncbi:MAG: radical SAM family heme chaperone HemW [Ruminococcus sp.]|nr:radical SAM family heme chaperone HemW [Ruminococcus sp.]
MNNSSKAIGIYIHIPFCKSKCPYCDFYSSRADESAYDKYLSILIDKIKYWGKKATEKVSTIYIGGGTPSILGASRLCKILNTINESFNVINDAEISVEINPESGKNIDFSVLQQCGFNRISIGLQSSNPDELKALGRIHSAEEAKLTVNKAQACGISNISLDLMMGIPYQTIESLEKSIEFCAKCNVTHISSYILKIEKNTKYDKIRDKLILPDEDKQAELYLYAVEKLKELGYNQYEISNFSKQGFESCHNVNYWECGEYIGIGPSAHSFYKGKRFYYPSSIAEFENNKYIIDCDGGSEEEFIMLSLRLSKGLNSNDFLHKFGKSLSAEFLNKVNKYVKYGLMQYNNDSISFTPQGFLLSNTILSDLI